MVSHEEHKGLPWGTHQQNGWAWMQNRPKKLHICLVLPRICHSITISVTLQRIVSQSLKPQVTDLQIFEENFLWYFQARSFLHLMVSLRKKIVPLHQWNLQEKSRQKWHWRRWRLPRWSLRNHGFLAWQGLLPAYCNISTIVWNIL